MTTTPMRPKTAYSGYLRIMTSVEQMTIATTLRRRKRWVRPQGTVKGISSIAASSENVEHRAYCVYIRVGKGVDRSIVSEFSKHLP